MQQGRPSTAKKGINKSLKKKNSAAKADGVSWGGWQCVCVYEWVAGVCNPLQAKFRKGDLLRAPQLNSGAGRGEGTPPPRARQPLQNLAE